MISDNFWTGKRVGITGHTGLIGGYLCAELVKQGASVKGMDLNASGTRMHHGVAVPWMKESVLDAWKVQDFCDDKDVIFHLAANSGVTASRNNGYSAFELNFMGTLNVLEACRFHDAGIHVVVASSNHVYGNGGKASTPEYASLNQLDTYSASKICADYLARSYAHNYGLKVSVMRNTNCFGPFDPHNDHIINATILSLMKDEAPIIKSDGNRVKSYMHVADTAKAYAMVGAAMQGGVWNLADERISVKALVEKIMTLFHRIVPADAVTDEFSPMPIMMGEPDDQTDEWLDSTKIRSLLGWKPAYTLDEALLDTIRWFRDSQSVWQVESALEKR